MRWQAIYICPAVYGPLQLLTAALSHVRPTLVPISSSVTFVTERIVDAPPGEPALPWDARGPGVQQDGHAMPGPLGDLRAGDPGVEPGVTAA
jgi:hypothetical protein